MRRSVPAQPTEVESFLLSSQMGPPRVTSRSMELCHSAIRSFSAGEVLGDPNRRLRHSAASRPTGSRQMSAILTRRREDRAIVDRRPGELFGELQE